MLKEKKLITGDKIPEIGFGTWDIAEEDVGRAVEMALEAGYNHIDTAEGYKNEEGIGRAIKDYDREKLYLTSKVLPKNLYYDQLLEAAERSINKLGVDYLDLYLIHWPNPAVSLRESLAAMNKLYQKGLVKSIGVSNFSIYQLMFALKITDVPIAVNQVEFHPYYYQKELLEFCKNNDIVVTASAPLARTKVLKDELIKSLAQKYDKSAAQIVLKWELAKGVVPLPKSTSAEHIKANLELYGWEIEQDDLEKIDQLEQQKKVYMISLDSETYGINA
ncbi:aldo/keto reductase [Halanaerobium hydrogeniformans]|uniref:2,5-didehydrogluconate reductase n=1 Tax=Halanaerobium hydrogeniformans TaxID=656519 RepID=E4RM36_HALHG|nr:aldo/keto reductase [Halanaerobium hydrogeniformans]ADQ14119.1 2,5-didehydrogluconate reductase [Halanaerobium hydrogeniformans]